MRRLRQKTNYCALSVVARPHSPLARSSGVVAAVRMILFLIPLLLTASSAVQLVEHFECGSPTVPLTMHFAEKFIYSCNFAVKDEANLCCKEHDLCYELHASRNNTREHCDERFCYCLQDVSDRSKNYDCKYHLSSFCRVTIDHGEDSFNQAVPHTEAEIDAKFSEFEDARPLGLDMQQLVYACLHTKALAIHCHNTVHTCLQSKHERFKRLMDVVEHSYEDCRSTMHDCMQMIIESETDSNCSSVARDIAKQANTYMELDEAKHGRSIIETYPIVAARLMKQCTESHFEGCFLDFALCAEHNPSEHPELLNPARKIKIECHRQLSSCINTAVIKERSEDCSEAQNLAIGRIRSNDLEPIESWWDIGKGYAESKITDILAAITGWG